MSLKKIEIWVEGFAVTGQSGTASKLGEYEAENFDHAVAQHMINKPDHGIKLYTRANFISEDAYINRRSNYNIWACALYDNEAQARKSFG